MTRSRHVVFFGRLTPVIMLGLVCVLAQIADAQGLPRQFEDAMLGGDYERAVTLGERLVAAYPKHSTAAFMLASACSRAGQLDRAIEMLTQSAKLGYAGVRSIRDAEDLEAVRSHAGFAAVQAAVAANAKARFDQFRAAAEQATPTILLPPDHDPKKPAPLIIMLHGTGGTGKNIARTWKKAAADGGAIVIAPDALRPFGQTAGYSWTFRDEAEWLVLRTIEEARKKWAIGPVILCGFSQGANIALMLGQSHPDQFDTVIPIAGHYESDVAIAPTEGKRPRWHLIIGDQDPWSKTYVEAERDFTKAGMTVRCQVMRRVGHAMPRDPRVLRNALAWATSDRK